MLKLVHVLGIKRYILMKAVYNRYGIFSERCNMLHHKNCCQNNHYQNKRDIVTIIIKQPLFYGFSFFLKYKNLAENIIQGKNHDMAKPSTSTPIETIRAQTKEAASLATSEKFFVLLLNTKNLFIKYANIIAIQMAIILHKFLFIFVSILNEKNTIKLTQVVQPPAKIYLILSFARSFFISLNILNYYSDFLLKSSHKIYKRRIPIYSYFIT